MKPVNHYYRGGPIFSFPTKYNTSGVRLMDEGDQTPEAAAQRGQKFISNYVRDCYVGEFLGVTHKGGKYYAVINTDYQHGLSTARELGYVRF